MIIISWCWAEAVFMHDPEDLGLWWTTAGQFSLGETAYRIDSRSYETGPCTVRFDEGIIIPIFSGDAPLHKHIVGAVYKGSGGLSLSFPKRADAWFFANYMQQFKQLPHARLEPIARQEKTYDVDIVQGVFFSLEYPLESLFFHLIPVGGGDMYTGKEGDNYTVERVENNEQLPFGVSLSLSTMLTKRNQRFISMGMDPRLFIRHDRLKKELIG